MFYSIKELVEQADLDFQGNVAELMIATEYQLTGRERPEVLLLMERNLEVMKPLSSSASVKINPVVA